MAQLAANAQSPAPTAKKSVRTPVLEYSFGGRRSSGTHLRSARGYDVTKHIPASDLDGATIESLGIVKHDFIWHARPKLNGSLLKSASTRLYSGSPRT